MYKNAHVNIIFNVKNIETICSSTRQEKKDMVYSYNEILYRQNDVQVMTTSFKNK